MNRIICDQCRAEVQPDTYGLAPHGWFRVNKMGDYGVAKDYCGTMCLVTAYSAPPVVPTQEEEIIL